MKCSKPKFEFHVEFTPHSNDMHCDETLQLLPCRVGVMAKYKTDIFHDLFDISLPINFKVDVKIIEDGEKRQFTIGYDVEKGIILDKTIFDSKFNIQKNYIQNCMTIRQDNIGYYIYSDGARRTLFTKKELFESLEKYHPIKYKKVCDTIKRLNDCVENNHQLLRKTLGIFKTEYDVYQDAKRIRTNRYKSDTRNKSYYVNSESRRIANRSFDCNIHNLTQRQISTLDDIMNTEPESVDIRYNITSYFVRRIISDEKIFTHLQSLNKDLYRRVVYDDYVVLSSPELYRFESYRNSNSNLYRPTSDRLRSVISDSYDIYIDGDLFGELYSELDSTHDLIYISEEFVMKYIKKNADRFELMAFLSYFNDFNMTQIHYPRKLSTNNIYINTSVNDDVFLDIIYRNSLHRLETALFLRDFFCELIDMSDMGNFEKYYHSNILVYTYVSMIRKMNNAIKSIGGGYVTQDLGPPYYREFMVDDALRRKIKTINMNNWLGME